MDGLLTGHEFDVTNNTTDQPLLSQPNSKTALSIVSNGSNPVTSAMIVTNTNGAANAFRRGLVVLNVLGDALNIPNARAITSRNAANTADENLLYADTNDNTAIGAPTGKLVIGASGLYNDSPSLKIRVFGATTTTAASAGALAATTYRWTSGGGTAFADANYIVHCQGAGPATGAPVIYDATTSSASQITVYTAALNAAAASFSSVTCMGVHY